MNLRTFHVFSALAGLHIMGFLLAPKPLAPVFAGSVYLPLTLLKWAGLPVYENSEGWGWAAPSAFGWLAAIVLWSACWWMVARLVTRSVRRRPQPR